MGNSEYSNWIGKTQEKNDKLLPFPAQFMENTLNRDATFTEGKELPPLWHWLYFLESEKLSNLGRDGHPKKGGFLPPVTLPRRMWAGGRFWFKQPLLLGIDSLKKSIILSVKEKNGSSGQLCFVTVKHEYFQNETLCLIEEHDIVYREDPKENDKLIDGFIAPTDWDIYEEITPSSTLLFRYSALTFNGHRIHYDNEYAINTEGYNGLVFHGPLIATLLIDLSMRLSQKTPSYFEFRGVSPISGPNTFSIASKKHGNELMLSAIKKDGTLSMKAKAVY